LPTRFVSRCHTPTRLSLVRRVVSFFCWARQVKHDKTLVSNRQNVIIVLIIALFIDCDKASYLSNRLNHIEYSVNEKQQILT
jgi:hypothetical protein